MASLITDEMLDTYAVTATYDKLRDANFIAKAVDAFRGSFLDLDRGRVYLPQEDLRRYAADPATASWIARLMPTPPTGDMA